LTRRISMSKIYALLSLCKANDRKCIVPDYRLKQDGTFLTWLFHTALQKATLAKNGILIFLGISTVEKTQNVSPDFQDSQSVTFRKSDREIFKEVTTHCLRTHGTLHPLQVGQEEKRLPLPSWVGDYSVLDSRFMNMVKYRADGGHDGKAWIALGGPLWMPNCARLVQFSTDLETLTVTGVIFDTIVYSDPTPWVDIYNGGDLQEAARVRRERMNKARRAFRTWQSEAAPTPSDPYHAMPGGRYEAFWRTLMLNQHAAPQEPPNSSVGTAFEDFMGADENATMEAKYAIDRRFYISAALQAQQRAFFITEGGYYGMGLKKVQRGDIVKVLRGGPTAFALRSKGKEFEFKGEAYLHGIMNGEVVRGAKKEDVRQFVLR
jgi:hypothetical protein